MSHVAYKVIGLTPGYLLEVSEVGTNDKGENTKTIKSVGAYNNRASVLDALNGMIKAAEEKPHPVVIQGGDRFDSAADHTTNNEDGAS